MLGTAVPSPRWLGPAPSPPGRSRRSRRPARPDRRAPSARPTQRIEGPPRPQPGRRCPRRGLPLGPLRRHGSSALDRRRRHCLRPMPWYTPAIEAACTMRTVRGPVPEEPQVVDPRRPQAGDRHGDTVGGEGRHQRSGATNSAGSWMLRGGPPGMRSPSATSDNRAQAVSLIVSNTTHPPGRRMRVSRPTPLPPGGQALPDHGAPTRLRPGIPTLMSHPAGIVEHRARRVRPPPRAVAQAEHPDDMLLVFAQARCGRRRPCRLDRARLESSYPHGPDWWRTRPAGGHNGQVTDRQISFRHDPALHRYVAEMGGTVVGQVVYRRTDDRLIFVPTEVDEDLQGRGIASQLARYALDDARASTSFGRGPVPLHRRMDRPPPWLCGPRGQPGIPAARLRTRARETLDRGSGRTRSAARRQDT